MLLAVFCPHPVPPNSERGSYLVRLVLELLAAPLIWLSLSPVFATRVVVCTLLAGALKLYRLEIGRDQPQSLARWYAVVSSLQFAFLATLSWTNTEVKLRC
jgi:hypothetical protein